MATVTTPEPNGHETLTAADAWFLMTGQAPTPEEEYMLDAILHKMYVNDFGVEPPEKWILPDVPRTEGD